MCIIPELVRYSRRLEMFLPLISLNCRRNLESSVKGRILGLPGLICWRPWFSLPSYQVPHQDVEGLRFLSCTGVKQSLFLLSVNFWFGCADNWEGEGFFLLWRADWLWINFHVAFSLVPDGSCFRQMLSPAT